MKIKDNNLITVPKHEHQWYQQEIALGHDVWTSRTHKEFGKYKIGQIYQSEFGIRLKVIEVNREEFSTTHPNYQNLTPLQKQQLKQAKFYDHVKLRPIN